MTRRGLKTGPRWDNPNKVEPLVDYAGFTAAVKSGEHLIRPEAQAIADAHGVTIDSLIDRHCSGDYGDIREIEREFNDVMIVRNGIVISGYVVDGNPGGPVIWIMTLWKGKPPREVVTIAGSSDEMLV